MTEVPKDAVIPVSRKELKRLFRNATRFIQWGEYERGYAYRRQQVVVAVDRFCDQPAHGNTGALCIPRGELIDILLQIVDDAYMYYFELNGEFRNVVDDCGLDALADERYRAFIANRQPAFHAIRTSMTWLKFHTT